MDSTNKQSVFVIDDDVEFAKSVRFLLNSVNFSVMLFNSAEDFLAKVDPQEKGCVLVDVRMPGLSGLELQGLLAKELPDLPVIIMTAHGDIDMAVRAMKDGVLDFIQKPFNDQRLIDLINKAMKLNAKTIEKRQYKLNQQKRLHRLTPREYEVLDLIVAGNTNKGIALQLGIADKTVEVHRANIMDKTMANSLQELMKLVLSLTPNR